LLRRYGVCYILPICGRTFLFTVQLQKKTARKFNVIANKKKAVIAKKRNFTAKKKKLQLHKINPIAKKKPKFHCPIAKKVTTSA